LFNDWTEKDVNSHHLMSAHASAIPVSVSIRRLYMPSKSVEADLQQLSSTISEGRGSDWIEGVMADNVRDI